MAFTASFLLQGNYEFLFYVAVVVLIFIIVLATLHKSNFDNLTLWGMSLWGLIHVAGSAISIGGGKVLYAKVLIPIINNGEMTIFKYDQFAHLFGFFVATLVGYHLLKKYLAPNTNWKVIYFLLVLIGMGFGALNEIIEFISVLSLPETGVGGYINNAST